MSKIIEVEMRGPLSINERGRLSEYLTKNGTLKEKKERILIDYSTFMEDQGVANRVKDIRLRTTNGVPEIIIKTGRWGGEESRTEYSVKTESNFDTLVQIYKLLGYSKGILCIRNSEVFEYKGIEISLVEVPGHSFYFEAEIEIENAEDIEDARKNIHKVIEELNLSVFSDKEFYKYIELLNREANIEFDATTVEENYFAEKYNV